MNKRVRLPDVKWITTKLPESKSEELALSPADEIWECGDGRKILVKDMDARHICNVIKLLKCRAATTISKVNSVLALDEKAVEKMAQESYPIFTKLNAELPKRFKASDAKPVEIRERIFNLDA